MRTEKVRNLLLKALDAFNRKIVVISKEFLILASAGTDALLGGDSPLGKAAICCFTTAPNPAKKARPKT